MRVRGVPFPIEFADWTIGDLVEQVENLVRDFARQLIAVIQENVNAVFVPRRPTPVVPQEESRAHTKTAAKPSRLKSSRKKGPIQLCPAPGCKERAAPVFGMVCKKHKGTPKTTVAKWREARRKKNGN